MYCKKCGQEMDANAKFCLNCGEQSTPETAPAQSPGQQQAPAYTPVQPFQQHSSVDPNQPQYQQTFFNGQQASVGTSGQVQFKNGGKKKKGCLIAAIIVFLLIVAGVVGLAFLGAGSSPIDNVQMASEINEDTAKPVVKTDVFYQNSPIIYCTFETNVDPGALITVEWWYVEEVNDEVYIESFELETEKNGDQVYFSLSQPTDGWPLGKYEIIIYVNDEELETAHFEVK